MPFEKGDTRINRFGRPAGSLNRTTQQMQLSIARIVNNSLDNLKSDLEEMRKTDPKAAAEIAIKLLNYAMPKLSNVEVKAEVQQKIQSINVTINQTGSGVKHTDNG
jgi:hypothetical protein